MNTHKSYHYAKIKWLVQNAFLFMSILILIKPCFSANRVVGYYPAWMQTSLPPEKVAYQNLTHINLAFAWPDANGNLQQYQGLVNTQMVSLAHQHGVQVLVSLGGWGNSDGFSPMAADSSRRANFIGNLAQYLQNNHLDGVDFDWEFPGSATDRQHLNQLIIELRNHFDAAGKDYLITFAVGTSDWKGQWYDYNTLKDYVDWFNAMCYDYHGSWSAHSGHNAPLYQPPGDLDGAVDVGMQYLNQTRSIPKDQLTVGMPFYGKQFNSSALYTSFTGQVSDLLYKEIAALPGSGWMYHWDAVAGAPYLTDDANQKLITFDDTTSIRGKCQWLLNEGYSGAMIWALGQDYYNGAQPLLQTIGRMILNPNAIANTTRPVHRFFLGPNYPNPFNATTVIPIILDKGRILSIDIFSELGERVQQLFSGYLPAGQHRFIFDAATLPSGVYFCRATTVEQQQTRSLILIK